MDFDKESCQGWGGESIVPLILQEKRHLNRQQMEKLSRRFHVSPAGCNRRWELAGVKPAVIRQQISHSSSAMTDRYTGEIPLDDVRSEFSMKFGNKIVVLENMENGAVA